MVENTQLAVRISTLSVVDSALKLFPGLPLFLLSLMTQSLVDIFCELALIEGFAIGIVMIYVVLYKLPVLNGHTTISGCLSMTHLLVEIFFEFGMVANIVFFAVKLQYYFITYHRFIRL